MMFTAALKCGSGVRCAGGVDIKGCHNISQSHVLIIEIIALRILISETNECQGPGCSSIGESSTASSVIARALGSVLGVTLLVCVWQTS